MQKKNVLTMALSVSLVGVIAVGGTLAYLSDQTTEVTNTFTFDDSISIDLKEHDQTLWNDTGWTGTTEQWDDKYEVEGGGQKPIWVNANTYDNVVPGQTIHKDPTVKMISVPESGANLYVSVSGLNSDLTSDMDIWTGVDQNGGWKKIADMDGSAAPFDDSANGVYVYVDQNGEPVEITSAQAITVFNTVTVNSELAVLPEEDTDVIIKAYSVQATGDLGKDQEGEPLVRDDLAIAALTTAATQD